MTISFDCSVFTSPSWTATNPSVNISKSLIDFEWTIWPTNRWSILWFDKSFSYIFQWINIYILRTVFIQFHLFTKSYFHWLLINLCVMWCTLSGFITNTYFFYIMYTRIPHHSINSALLDRFLSKMFPSNVRNKNQKLKHSLLSSLKQNHS